MEVVRGDMEERSKRPSSVIGDARNPNIIDLMQSLNLTTEEEAISLILAMLRMMCMFKRWNRPWLGRSCLPWRCISTRPTQL
jgi:hypothetical protein